MICRKGIIIDFLRVFKGYLNTVHRKEEKMKKTVLCFVVVFAVIVSTIMSASAAGDITLPEYMNYNKANPVSRYSGGDAGGVFTSEEEAYAELGLTPLKDITFIDGTPMGNYWEHDGEKIYESVDLMFDFNKETKLCYSGGPIRAIAEFKTPVTIDGIVVTTGTDSPQRSPGEWAVFVSSNGEDWTELIHSNKDFFIDWHHHYSSGVNLDPVKNVKYIFFEASDPQVQDGPIQVAELIFCGSAQSSFTEESPDTADFTGVAVLMALISTAAVVVISKKRR